MQTRMTSYRGIVGTTYKMLCNDSGNTAHTRMATGEKGPATRLEPGTYTLSRSVSHEPLGPTANPSSPIALCTGSRCAAIQRSLRAYTLRLVLCDVVVVGSVGDQRVA